MLIKIVAAPCISLFVLDLYGQRNCAMFHLPEAGEFTRHNGQRKCVEGGYPLSTFPYSFFLLFRNKWIDIHR